MKEKKTREPIKNEAGNNLKNERGTIAMARTSEPHSATSQFFINTVDNKGLDRANARDNVGYAVFGRVVEGLDVVDKIRRVETGSKGGIRTFPSTMSSSSRCVASSNLQQRSIRHETRHA